VVLVRLDVSEKHIASIFRVRDSPLVAARMYLMKDRKRASCNNISIVMSVTVEI
jgi:hypothetical protein